MFMCGVCVNLRGRLVTYFPQHIFTSLDCPLIVCALHGVSLLTSDRWLCVLPRRRLNVRTCTRAQVRNPDLAKSGLGTYG